MSRNIVNFAALIKVASVAACGALVAVAACDNGASTTAGSGGTTGATTSAKATTATVATTGTPGATTGTPGATTGTPGATTGTPATTTAAGTGGSTGTGGMTLDPTATGYVQDTPLGITGSWYAYGDEVGPTGTPGAGNCETVGMHMDSECSSISSPILPAGTAGFPPDATGAMCLTGIAAVVPMLASTAMPDYSNVFGIGIGLDFNNIKGVKGTWNATTAMPMPVTGFSFMLTGIPTGGVRVEFPIPATDAAGSDSWTYNAMMDGLQTVHFADCVPGAAGSNCSLVPAFTMTAANPPFDPTMMESIQVHVPTNTTAAVTVTNLCLSALTPLFD